MDNIIQGKLVEIITDIDIDLLENGEDSNNERIIAGYNYIESIILNSNDLPSNKILILACQAIEKCCDSNKSICWKSIDLLCTLFNYSASDRTLKLICVQFISRISKLIVQGDSYFLKISNDLTIISKTLNYLKTMATDNKDDYGIFNLLNTTIDNLSKTNEFTNEECKDGSNHNDCSDKSTSIVNKVVLSQNKDNIIILEDLNENKIANLRILLKLTHIKWLEIAGRLDSFFKQNITTATIIQKCMKILPTHISNMVEFAGFKYNPNDVMSRQDYDKLKNVAKQLSDEKFYNNSFDFLSEEGEERDNLISDALILNKGNNQNHDDATSFLLIRNLPPDTRLEELLTLLQSESGCTYLELADIVIPFLHKKKDDESPACHAFINFRRIEDARNTRNILNSQLFGGKILEIEFSVGKPNKVVWIGGMTADCELTEKDISNRMIFFGPVVKIDLRKDKIKNKCFCFVEFEYLEDAKYCVKSICKKNDINKVPVRVAFSYIFKDKDNYVDKDMKKSNFSTSQISSNFERGNENRSSNNFQQRGDGNFDNNNDRNYVANSDGERLHSNPNPSNPNFLKSFDNRGRFVRVRSRSRESYNTQQRFPIEPDGRDNRNANWDRERDNYRSQGNVYDRERSGRMMYQSRTVNDSRFDVPEQSQQYFDNNSRQVDYKQNASFNNVSNKSQYFDSRNTNAADRYQQPQITQQRYLNPSPSYNNMYDDNRANKRINADNNYQKRYREE